MTSRRAGLRLSAHSTRGRKWLLAGLLGCGVLAAVAVIVAAVVYFLATSEPPDFAELRRATQPPAAASARPPISSGPGASARQPAGQPPAPQATSAAIPPLDRQVNAIARAVKQGYRGPAQVVVTDRDLTAQLREGLARAGVNNLTAVIKQNEIVVAAKVPFAGRQAPVVIHLRPEVTDGALRFVITRASIGRISLPDSRVQQLQKKLDEKVTHPLLTSRSVRITDVHLQPGTMVVQAEVGNGRR